MTAHFPALINKGPIVFVLEGGMGEGYFGGRMCYKLFVFVYLSLSGLTILKIFGCKCLQSGFLSF